MKRGNWRQQPLSEKLEKQAKKREISISRIRAQNALRGASKKDIPNIEGGILRSTTLKITGKKHKGLNRLGKVGKANMEANKILAEILPKEYCEVRFNNDVTCMGNWPLQWAHKHKRAFYKGDVTKLSDKKEVVVACQVCHDRMEHDAELTEKVFKKLRP